LLFNASFSRKNAGASGQGGKRFAPQASVKPPCGERENTLIIGRLNQIVTNQTLCRYAGAPDRRLHNFTGHPASMYDAQEKHTI